MRISKIYAAYRPVISLEIFPPRTEDRVEIVSRLAADFQKLGPAFISVTYGAGGTTRGTTVEIASLLSGFGFTVTSHLTGRGHTVKEGDEVLSRLHAAGVENILALRGDPPRAAANVYTAGDFAYAVDLIRHFRSKGVFGIAAAYPEGHIESPRIDLDWRHLKEKVDAGAEFLVTQLFFDNRVFYHFLGSIRRMGCATLE
ncbi:methylenetetrahydrofolate reductase [Thermodesulfitimonas sp.]